MSAPQSYPAELSGIIEGMPDHVYHRRPEWSKHKLDDLAVNPAFMLWRMSNPFVPTDEMRFGSLVDMALFEPDRFEAETVVIPADAPKRPAERSVNAANPKRETLQAIAWWKEFDNRHPGAEQLTQDEARRINAILDRIYSHKTASRLIGGAGRAQASMFWTDPVTGLRMRGRPDYLHPEDILVDLKKVRSVNARDFRWQVRDLRYDVQLALYGDAYQQITGRKIREHAWIAFESEDPFHVVTYRAPEDMLERGRTLYRRDIDTLAECLRTNTWPSYSEELLTLEA